MRRIWIVLAALALSPFAAACGQRTGAAEAVTIPFAPPLDQPLYYRILRTDQGPAGTQRRQSLFVVTFSRDANGLAMAVSGLRPDGTPIPATGDHAPLDHARFRIGPGGEMTGMENERVYWAAVERALAEHGPTEAAARESRAMLQSARDTKALPTSERMISIARNAWPITFYARDTYTREPQDAPAGKRSILGPIEGIKRTFAREISPDRIVVVENFVISPQGMQAALDNIAARYGRRPEGVGSRHISNVSQTVTELDPRTGLVRRREDRTELITQEAGRRLQVGNTVLLERVGAPVPAWPGKRAAAPNRATSAR